MQLDPELTLDKAIALARQSEAVHKQQPVVRGMQQQDCPTVEQEKIDTLSYNNPKNANKFRHTDRQRFPRNNTGGGPLHKEQTKQKCSRCGKSPKHSKQQCQKTSLARNVTRNVTRRATTPHIVFRKMYLS